MDKALNPKQQRFVEEYLKDLNATQAAIRAGYSRKTAEQQGSRLLGNRKVELEIAAAKRQRSEETGIDAKLVLTRLGEYLEADPAEILDKDGNVKPLQDWPPVWRRMLSGFEVSELFAGSGEDRESIGYLKKIKWLDRIKVIELLGKHVDVNAFREQMHHTGQVDVAQRILEARRRTGGKQ